MILKTRWMFIFARLWGEDDMKPSKENDLALCKACQHQAKDLIHPSCGGFLGGHKNVCDLKWDSSDDESDYEFI